MLLPNREECNGCGSCAAACPGNCIRMIADAEGFLYPQVDESRCVDCKQCERACAVIRRPKCSSSVQVTAAQNRDETVRQQSSSGGVFTALAEQVLRQGGAVCAAVYNEAFEVEHRIAFTPRQLAPMRGAKYAQSPAGQLFRQLKELLDQGKTVMFVGTPCQCAGLKAYLGREREGLILVDMICHGVPAPVVWKNYVNRRRRLDARGGRISSIDLRNKSTGWSNYTYSVEFRYEGGETYSTHQWFDPYMRGFVSNLFLRPSCSGCTFKGVNRCSDLTLGDCWGIWNTHPQFDDNRGTSLLLIQSPKGQQLWEQVRDGFRTVDLTAEALNCNGSALTASEAHPMRQEFFSRFSKGEPMEKLIPKLLSDRTLRQSRIKRILSRLRSR